MSRSSTTVWRDQAAIALVSASIVILQVALSRLLSVLLWYHAVFLVVALVMLGLGLPGVALSGRSPSSRTLVGALLASALAVPAGIVSLLAFSRAFPTWTMATAVVALLPGFLALGTSVCLLLARAEGVAVRRVYAADLGGATLGAMAVIPVLWWLPTPMAAAASGTLSACAAILLGGYRTRLIAPLLVVGTLGLCLSQDLLVVRHTKSYDEGKVHGKMLYERWTPTARLVVFDRFLWSETDDAFVWGPGATHERKLFTQYWLEQDGNAGTPITDGRQGLEALQFIADDVTSLVYRVRPADKVAVVGVGGGRDVIAALLGGARQVHGIELNQGIVDLMRGPYREFSGRLYDDARVTIHADEGRSYLARSTDRFDVVQISLVDTWAATAAGAFALSESNLYTIEAFNTFLDRLAVGGLLSVSRWADAETSRLLALANAALRARGVSPSERHVVAVRGNRVVNLIVSPTPFAASELEAIGQLARALGFEIVAAPGQPLAANPALIGLDLRPPLDDRPFFFQFKNPFVPAPHDPAVGPLQATIFGLGLFTMVGFGLPFLRRRVGGDGKAVAAGTIYMFGIGAGFMFVEMAFLQRFVLLLGHPSYATTVVLTALLGGLGLGALAAGRMPRALAMAGVLAIVGLNAVLPSTFAAALPLSLPWRSVIAFAILLPVGVAMGPWLPWAMAAFAPAQRPWLWAANGTASVLATLLAVPLAIAFGFSTVTLIGVSCYLVAWGASLSVPRR